MKQEFAIAAEMQTQGNFMVLASSTIIGAGAVMQGPDGDTQGDYFKAAQTALTALIGKQNSSNLIKFARVAADYMNNRGWDAIHGFTNVQDAGLAFAHYLKETHDIKNRTQLQRYMKTGETDKSELQKAMDKDKAEAATRAENQVNPADIFAAVLAPAPQPGEILKPDPAPEQEVKTFDPDQFKEWASQLSAEDLAQAIQVLDQVREVTLANVA